MDEQNRTERIRALVDRITFQSETFSVLRCRVKGYSDTVTVVGNLPGVHVGAVLTIQVFWKIDRQYGRQFSAISYEESLPASLFGIQKYLGSGLVKGIGPVYSKRSWIALERRPLRSLKSIRKS